MNIISNFTKYRNYIVVSALSGTTMYCYNNKHKVYEFITPILNTLDPEISHNIVTKLLSNNLYFDYPIYNSKRLNINLIDKVFKTPIGLSAGFDKNAEIYKPLNNFGFGFLELGTIVKNPQVGNLKPRIFKSIQDQSIINNLGLNSKGIDYFQKNISKRNKNQILGINISSNKITDDEIQDYKDVIPKINKYADYIVLNLSCPNVEKNKLSLKFIEDLVKNIDIDNNYFIKIPPNIDDYLLYNIILLIKKYNLTGIIVSNTLKTKKGGLSGQKLNDINNKLIEKTYRLSKGEIIIIGSGGVMCAKDAYKKIKLGANLIQVYTTFVLNGPKIIYELNRDLDIMLSNDGFENIEQAVGIDINLNSGWYKYMLNNINYYIDYWRNY